MRRGILKTLFVMLIMTAFIGCVSVFADEVDEDVKTARKGVLQIQLTYEDKEGNKGIVGGGSAFLINEDTILTCYHVIHVEENLENYQEAMNMFGEDFEPNNVSINVVVRDDITIQAKLVNESAAKDFAILELEQPISNREILSLNSTGNISATQQVYALGFPDVVSNFQNTNTYTYDDVTISDGRVTKTNESDGVKYVQHSADLSSGYSGGPLVTNMGVVVAMNRGTLESNSYSVSIDQITATLDDLGIQYTKADSSVEPETEEPETEPVETEEPETEPVETEEPETEPTEKPTVAEEDEEDKEGLDQTTIIIIVAIVVVVIIIIVILIVSLGGKKKKTQPPTMQHGVRAQMNGQNGMGPVGGGMTPPPVATPPVRPSYIGNDGGDATTVLNEGGDQTTVLGVSAQQMSARTITRSKNGERILINRPEFLIGKERRRVDYCISDNSSISRVHVKLVNRNGQLFIIDMNATNGTFVNGTKVAPGQETRLSTGDRFKLADEEFQVM